MLRALVVVLVGLVGFPSGAQGLEELNLALTAYNSGAFEEAAGRFYQVYGASTDDEVRKKAEYYLAASLHRSKLPFLAFVSYAAIVKAGPAHPFHARALEALVELQEELHDDHLIPSLLNTLYDAQSASWSGLSAEARSRINELMGRVSFRLGRLEEAKQFFEAVPFASSVYARSQYMLGVTLADPRFPAADTEARRANARAALEIFERTVLKSQAPNQKDLSTTHQLARLAIARVAYGLGEFARAVEWYERVPRFSEFWDQALFENGFARFQNDDPGGALGSLQALHAPQFAGAFQPESWILKSTIFYFACLYDEARSTLAEFERLYGPMATALEPSLKGSDARADAELLRLLEDEATTTLPRAVFNWVRSNERIVSLFALRRAIERERGRLGELAASQPSWRGATMTQELTAALDENKATLEQVAARSVRTRLNDAYRTMRGFGDQAEIVRFEVAKAEKELAERDVKVEGLLAGQRLRRPRMPAASWNYWRFQGEFWRDEIGYYQYTLKSGCPEAKP